MPRSDPLLFGTSRRDRSIRSVCVYPRAGSELIRLPGRTAAISVRRPIASGYQALVQRSGGSDCHVAFGCFLRSHRPMRSHSHQSDRRLFLALRLAAVEQSVAAGVRYPSWLTTSSSTLTTSGQRRPSGVGRARALDTGPVLHPPFPPCRHRTLGRRDRSEFGVLPGINWSENPGCTPP